MPAAKPSTRKPSPAAPPRLQGIGGTGRPPSARALAEIPASRRPGDLAMALLRCGDEEEAAAQYRAAGGLPRASLARQRSRRSAPVCRSARRGSKPSRRRGGAPRPPHGAHRRRGVAHRGADGGAPSASASRRRPSRPSCSGERSDAHPADRLPKLRAALEDISGACRTQAPQRTDQAFQAIAAHRYLPTHFGLLEALVANARWRRPGEVPNAGGRLSGAGTGENTLATLRRW